MNKEKILRFLHAVIGLLTVAPLVAGSISTSKAVVILATASAVKEILLILGDLLDDWQLNKSFSALAISFLVLFGMSGCVNLAPTVRALAKDPAKVDVEISTPWGKATLHREGVAP
jgi:hypothetical protein